MFNPLRFIRREVSRQLDELAMARSKRVSARRAAEEIVSNLSDVKIPVGPPDGWPEGFFERLDPIPWRTYCRYPYARADYEAALASLLRAQDDGLLSDDEEDQALEELDELWDRMSEADRKAVDPMPVEELLRRPTPEPSNAPALVDCVTETLKAGYVVVGNCASANHHPDGGFEVVCRKSRRNERPRLSDAAAHAFLRFEEEGAK